MDIDTSCWTAVIDVSFDIKSKQPVDMARNKTTRIVAVAPLLVGLIVHYYFRNVSAWSTTTTLRSSRVPHSAAAAHNYPTSRPISLDQLSGKRILVVGGSGRVGGSVTTQLVSHSALVTVGGTRSESLVASRVRWMTQFPSHTAALAAVPFVPLHRNQADTILPYLIHNQETNSTRPNFDLVVHTAGPFQGKATEPNGVLQACVQAGIPYLDVCDDYTTAVAARTQWHATAVQQTVPCIVSTGCWPGVSSLMAQQLVSQTLEQRRRRRHSNDTISPQDLSVQFSFFTAGSGGAGVTLLVATFLILAEPALRIVNGQRRLVPAMSSYTDVDFGPTVGTRRVAPLNLLETASIHTTLGVGNVSSVFGTAPDIWNALLSVMAKLPSQLLSNEPIMRSLSLFSLPIVRLVDSIAGATNAMRCDVTYRSPNKGQNHNGDDDDDDDSWTTTAIYAHDNLEPCVGECVTAFCCALLSGQVECGFPNKPWWTKWMS
jgi:saccharopine dehydrogenase-like NADP-dependent oxidoreductase